MLGELGEKSAEVGFERLIRILFSGGFLHWEEADSDHVDRIIFPICLGTPWDLPGGSECL